MATESMHRHSRWMLRVLEWSDPRAKYPNLWRDGMPVHVLAFNTVAIRLRLGDLIAVFHPMAKAGEKGQGSFLGLSRVIGLRRSHMPDRYWIDLETAHRLNQPQQPEKMPRRVFLCCDPEWSGPEVSLFQKLFDAAVAEGWTPVPGDDLPEAAPEASKPSDPGNAPVEEPSGGRLFGGAVLGGTLRDLRDETWMAVVRLQESEEPRLTVAFLEPTGRSGLARMLRSPDGVVLSSEAIGLAFPFALPLPFVRSLCGGEYPEGGWWGLVGRLEKISYPEYLEKIQEYCREHGEAQRWTDERVKAGSPLQRSNPDLGSMAYHGIRMLAEQRSRYAIRPFESARGRLLFEVRPQWSLVGLDEQSVQDVRSWSGRIRDRLADLPELPVVLDDRRLRTCRSHPGALGAVLVARQAASAVLSGEVDRGPEERVPDEADRIRKEGWIY